MTPENKRRLNNEAAKRWRVRHPEKAKQVGRDSERRRRTERREEWLKNKRAWNAANREKSILSARRTLCRNHGITLEIYNEILARQGGVCAICMGSELSKSGMLSIDHDHSCCPRSHGCAKCVRGLLCQKCNAGIGCLRDDPKILESATAYLKRARPVREQVFASGDTALEVV